MHNRCYKGGERSAGMKTEHQEPMVQNGTTAPQHKPTLYPAAPTPIPLLFTPPGINLALFSPSPLQPSAISPHSTPCPTSNISSAPQTPHQVSYLPSKDLRIYSVTCKQLTSLRHPPIPHYKSNFTKN